MNSEYTPHLFAFHTFLQTEGPRNTWIHEDGFEFYVRKSQRFYNGSLVKMTDLANINSEHPGSGNFHAFLRKFQEINWSLTEQPIIIENVINERLAISLRNQNWRELRLDFHPTFIRTKEEFNEQ